MLSANEGRRSAMELASILKGISCDKKLILEGIMIGINMGEVDPRIQDQRADAQSKKEKSG